MKPAQLQAYLHSLEERLLHPDKESNRSALIPLLAEEFQEFCTSGRIMNREQVIEALLKAHPRAATISYFYTNVLSENVALATYHATTATYVSHRSSLWIFRDNRWQLFFHQGTIAA